MAPAAAVRAHSLRCKSNFTKVQHQAPPSRAHLLGSRPGQSQFSGRPRPQQRPRPAHPPSGPALQEASFQQPRPKPWRCGTSWNSLCCCCRCWRGSRPGTARAPRPLSAGRSAIAPTLRSALPLPVGLILKAVREVVRSLSCLSHLKAFLFSDFLQRLGNFPGLTL